MSSPALKLVVIVAPRAGDEEVSLPVRVSELTGKSRSQVAIELQRGEVELLRTSDTDEVSKMVASAAAAGLLAVVREVAARPAAPAPAADGWGRVLGDFNAKVAVAPSVAPAGRPVPSKSADAWRQAPPLRLSDGPSASEPEEVRSGGRASGLAELDLLASPGEQAAASRSASLRRKPAPTAAAKRFPLRTGIVLLAILLTAGLAAAAYRKLNHTFERSGTAIPAIAAPEPEAAPAEAPSATTEKDVQAQVKRLTDRARDACKNADFERCKELADQALDLDETSRAAQAVHIRAVTAISAAVGKPPSPSVSP